LAKEAHLPGISRGATIMPQRLSQKECRAVKPKGGQPGVACQSPLDLAGQRGRHLFVGIDAQDPRLRRLFDSEILLGPVTRPGTIEDTRPKLSGQLRSPIGTAAVHDDPFWSPTHAGEAPHDVAFLVLGD